MADGVTIKIEGTAEIDRALKRLHDLGSRKRDITKIFSNNMKPLITAGRMQAPGKSGRLRRSIKFKTSKKYKNVWYVRAGRNSNRRADGWYAHMVGQGTVNQLANPFMDRAWAATSGTVLSGLEKDLWALGHKLWEGR